MRQKILRKIGVLLGACLMLAACGQQENFQEAATSVSERSEIELPGADAVPTPALQAEADWTEKRIPGAGAVKDAFLYVTGNESLDYTEPAGTIAHTYQQLACGGFFYLLDTCYLQETTNYYFQRIDGATGAGERISLCPDTWDIENGLIEGMDIVDANRCVFWVRSRDAGDKEDWHNYMVYTDNQGQMLQRAELTDTLRENSIWAEPDQRGVPLGCDGLGNVYIDDADRHTVYLLDADGRLSRSHVYRSEEITGVRGSFRASGGERILVCGAPGEWEWIRMDAETEDSIRLSSDGIKNVQRWCVLDQNILYYVADHQLIGWNVATGERKLLVKLDEISDYENTLDMAVMPTEDGVRLLITERDRAKRYMITLSENPLPVNGEIVVANLYGESSFLSERVISFGRDNPACQIQYRAAYREEEADRILMETANGGGPDILYLSSQDMRALQANGALGELEQLISQDTLDVLLPGAIQAGTCEDGLYAIPLSVYVRTLLTSRACWQEDSWTTEEIFSVLENHSEIEGLFLDMAGQDEFFYNLYFLAGTDTAHSPFLRDGISSFDCQEFRDIMILVKERTQKAENNSSPYDRVAPLASGKYLGVEYLIWDLQSFDNACDKMGDNANWIGYPSDRGSCHYLTDNGMLAVSQNAMEKPEVRELVNYLLSLESQQRLSRGISVRMDVPKEDESSWLKEYLELLQKAVPATFDADDIYGIVMEEADSYFHSDKDLDTVIDIIQKRVQLYLDERK